MNNMKKQVISEIVEDRKNQSNKQIIETLSFLSEKHETTKETIMKLSYELDEIENFYNKLLDEFNNRKQS